MNKAKNIKYYIGMVVAMLVWGIAWIVGKVAVEHSNPDVCAFWRYFIRLLAKLQPRHSELVLESRIH